MAHRPDRSTDPPRRVSEGAVGRIRPIAAAVIRAGERILVWEDLDPATGEVVAVPLAGGIEFGETGEAAIRRELMEEIGAAASEVRYLGTLEDIFEWNGQRRHELHLVYEVELADRRFLGLDQVDVDDDGERYVARWRPLSAFREDERLVPDGLLALIDDQLPRISR
jgi:ADP-ribose pyrophosphatase YjhB (NUDIX family)